MKRAEILSKMVTKSLESTFKLREWTKMLIKSSFHGKKIILGSINMEKREGKRQ